MSESLTVTAEEIGTAFNDHVRFYRKPPILSIESVESLAPREGFRIQARDLYGPLPESEIITRGEHSRIIEAIKETATLTYAVARVRQEIQDCFSGCTFLVTLFGEEHEKFAGVTRDSGKAPIVAGGRDYLDAYISLREKLVDSSGMKIVSDRMIQTLFGLNSIFLAASGLSGQGEEGAAIFDIAATQLEKAGIRVVKDEKELARYELPVLLIRVDLLHRPDGYTAISMRLELWQMVSPARSQELKTAAITWLTPAAIEVTKSDTVNAAILEVLLKQLELFIESHRYANGNNWPSHIEG
jgi:hypothetical protein